MSTKRAEDLLAVALAVVLVGSAVAVGGALAGEPAEGEPTTEDPDTQATAYLRVVHASPDAPAVDVAVDNETVLTDVAFGEVSDYRTLEAGTHNVTITAAEDPDDVVFDEEVALDPRSATTFAAAGETGENASTPFEPLLYDDDALEPQGNESAVSVIHLSPDAPAVDVTAENGSVVLAENVSYGNASDYETVPAGEYTVEVREATEDNDGPVVTTTDVSLEGGTAYSALAVGSLEDGNESAEVDDEPTEAEDESADATEEAGDTPAGEDDAPVDAGNESADAGDDAADAGFEIVLTEDVAWTVTLPSEDAPADANETATETPAMER